MRDVAAVHAQVIAGIVKDASARRSGVTVVSRPAHIEKVRTVVTGDGVFAIDAEMDVGTVTETVTVTAQTPVVDTQSVRAKSC